MELFSSDIERQRKSTVCNNRKKFTSIHSLMYTSLFSLLNLFQNLIFKILQLLISSLNARISRDSMMDA
jgi:hypothetical protein